MKEIPSIEYDDATLQEVEILRTLILAKIKRLEELENYEQLDIEKYLNKIYLFIAKQYYKETNQHINIEGDYKLTKKEKRRIFKWLNKKRRYELYNVLIQEQYNMLTRTDDIGNEYDPFIKNNISELINYIQQDVLSHKIIKKKALNRTLPSLTPERLEELMEEYLIEIDPSLKWLEIYKEAMAKENIVYTNKELDWYCSNEYGYNMISAPLSNTLSDFPNLVHEFAHYVANLNVALDDFIYNSIREYPSLFLENHAIHFLEKKGYSKKDISKLLMMREYTTQNNELTASAALIGIKTQQDLGEITKEKKIKQCSLGTKNKISNNIKRYIFGIVKPTEECVDAFVDKENRFLLEDKLFFNSSYPYIIASYLTSKTRTRLFEDSAVLGTVLEITENLVNENVRTITEKLNITIDFNLEEKTKKYIKKEQD